MEKTKRYTGGSMSEILDRIKLEMGRDAIIYQSTSKTRRFKGGMQYEVIAGINPVRETVKLRSGSAVDSAKIRKAIRKGAGPNPSGVPERGTVLPVAQQAPMDIRDLQDEIKALRMSLTTLHPESSLNLPQPLDRVWQKLQEAGGDREWVNRFAHALRHHLGNRLPGLSSDQLNRFASSYLEKVYWKKNGLPQLRSSRVKLFLGPTGGGKTTTLAKLASRAALKDKKDLILISLDDYRMGAHAQLKTYADILQVPFYAVHNPSDLKRLIGSLPENVEIFIDTSGVSPNNAMGVKRLASFIKALPNAEVYLVLMATLSYAAQCKIQDKFEPTSWDRLILTKLDEGEQMGHLLGYCYRKARPICYTTHGQAVPEDIAAFRASTLVAKILEVA